MKILAIETSGRTASACIVNTKKIICEIYLDNGLTHSQSALPMIDACLSLSNLSLDEIDVLAVGRGPGSFTGVRIGISIIKGLSSGSDKKIMDVCSLEALAENLVYEKGIICPVMDARRNQIYGGIFLSDGEGSLKKISDNFNISVEDFFLKLANIENKNENVFLVGDGAEMCYNYAKSIHLSNINLYLAPINQRLQKASSVAQLTLKRIDNNIPLKASSELKPSYLRLPQAQREREKKI